MSSYSECPLIHVNSNVLKKVPITNRRINRLCFFNIGKNLKLKKGIVLQKIGFTTILHYINVKRFGHILISTGYKPFT
jgi:hypothetical protein